MIEVSLSLIGQEVKIISPKIHLHYYMKRTIVWNGTVSQNCNYFYQLWSSWTILLEGKKIMFQLGRSNFSRCGCLLRLAFRWAAWQRTWSCMGSISIRAGRVVSTACCGWQRASRVISPTCSGWLRACRVISPTCSGWLRVGYWHHTLRRTCLSDWANRCRGRTLKGRILLD